MILSLCSLALQVQVATDLQDKISRVIPFLKTRTGPAIVYVTLQRHADEVANYLRPHGLDPMVYHAGLPNEERQRIQKKFMESDDGIVCATIAFGMGIDKGMYHSRNEYRGLILHDYSQYPSGSIMSITCFDH